MSRIRQARILGVAGWVLIGLAAWMLAPVFGRLGAPSSLRILLFDASASVTRTGTWLS